MNCPNCRERLPEFARNCPACQHDIGFPNVRAASTPEEQAALEDRVATARTSARARNCGDLLELFGQEILNSRVVICRSLGQVQQLISDENQLYPTFYQQVRGESRLPEHNEWDRGRAAVDATLFPYYHEQIRFGALTLNYGGLSHTYGACAMFLKEPMISNRATVFEENPFLFLRKHHVVAGDRLPCGYRTTWSNRGKLAMAKLHSELVRTMSHGDFPAVLMKQRPDGQDDFVEVHIYGSFTRSAIERIVIPTPKSRADSVIVRSLKKKLRDLSIPLEVR